jgi:hypothetical protein
MLSLTPYETLLSELDALGNKLITPEQAKSLIKKHLSGKRVFCSNRQPHRGYLLAQQLIAQGLAKNIAINIITERLGYSKQWANSLANFAIDEKFRIVTHRQVA